MGERGARQALDFLGREALLVVITGVIALEALVRFRMFDDSWLTLAIGRSIAQHGLPSHDTLTAWTRGRLFVDQQWLAQVVGYQAVHLGGIRLAALLYVALVAAALGGAMAAARTRGASPRAVAWTAAAALVPFHLVAANPRAQTGAYVLFVGLLWSLRSELRRRSILLALALLVIWANVHGSVVLGASLVASRGGLELVRTRGRSLTGWALVLLAWPCLLASPYGLQLPHYYRTILFDSNFTSIVTEWAPTTLSLETLPLYVLAFGAIWLIGRTRPSFSAFEITALLLLVPVSLVARRDMVWLALAAIIILPRALDDVLASATPGATVARLNKLLGTATVLLLAGVTPVSLSRADRAVAAAYPKAAAQRVAAAAECDRSTPVFADVAYADWLLWEEPQLEGQVAFDARFELLTSMERQSVVDFISGVDGWMTAVARFDVFALDARREAAQVAALRAHRHLRTLYRTPELVVLAATCHT